MGSGLDAIRNELESANRRIAEAEERLTQQRRRMAQAAVAGLDPACSQALLALMNDGLQTMKRHRQLILREIAEIKKARQSVPR